MKKIFIVLMLNFAIGIVAADKHPRSRTTPTPRTKYPNDIYVIKLIDALNIKISEPGFKGIIFEGEINEFKLNLEKSIFQDLKQNLPGLRNVNSMRLSMFKYSCRHLALEEDDSKMYPENKPDMSAERIPEDKDGFMVSLNLHYYSKKADFHDNVMRALRETRFNPTPGVDSIRSTECAIFAIISSPVFPSTTNEPSSHSGTFTTSSYDNFTNGTLNVTAQTEFQTTISPEINKTEPYTEFNQTTSPVDLTETTEFELNSTTIVYNMDNVTSNGLSSRIDESTTDAYNETMNGENTTLHDNQTETWNTTHEFEPFTTESTNNTENTTLFSNQTETWNTTHEFRSITTESTNNTLNRQSTEYPATTTAYTNDAIVVEAATVALHAISKINITNYTDIRNENFTVITTSFEIITSSLNETTENATTEAVKDDLIRLISETANLLFDISEYTIYNEDILNITFNWIDGIISLPQFILDAAQQQEQTSTNLIDIAELLLKNVRLDLDYTIEINYKSVEAFRFEIDDNSSVYPIGFVADQNGKMQIMDNKTSISGLNGSYGACLNKEAVKFYETLNDTSDDYNPPHLTFIAYKSTKLFRSCSKRKNETAKRSYLSDQVLSVGLEGYTRLQDGDLVNITFKTPTIPNLKKAKNVTYTCVYWDFDGNNGTGDWNTIGCRYYYEDGTNVCVCNHTTNFAMIVSYDVYNELDEVCPWCKKALAAASVLGSSLSIFFLCISIVVFIMDEIRRVRNHKGYQFEGIFYHYYKLLIGLCVNLILFNTLFIVISFVKPNDTSPEACVTIGVLLHFFLITSFMLMFSMALFRYLMFTCVFKNIRHFNLIAFVGSILVGCFIVSLALIIPPGPSRYRSQKANDNNDDGKCWMDGVDIMFVYIPIAIITLTNTVLFILAFYEIRRQYKARQKLLRLTKARSMEVTRLAFICFVTSGLTWLIGLVLILPIDPLVKFLLASIFCILNSLQGVLIFISCVVFRLLSAGLKSKYGMWLTFKHLFSFNNSWKSAVSANKNSSQSTQSLNFTSLHSLDKYSKD